MEETRYGLRTEIPVNYERAVELITNIVYEVSPERTAVSAMAALGIVGDNAELQAVAREADGRLRSSLRALEKATAAAAPPPRDDRQSAGSGDPR